MESYLSLYNKQPEVLGEVSLPSIVKFYDTTLRDGEQTVGVVFRPHEKLEIAKRLAKIGVDRIEAGMPVVSEEDKKAVEMIVHEVEGSEIWGFCRCLKSDIDACVEVGVKSVICEIALSDYKLKAYDLTVEDSLKRMLESVTYAKEKGLFTAFFAVDATRAKLSVLEEAYKLAVEKGGADEVVIVDTLGVATPETMYYLSKKVKSWVDVPLMVHCHNDFGMAVACSLAAVKGGAEVVQVTINGLGEKTGNADLSEMALTLNLLYGVSHNIDLKGLKELAAYVEDLSNVPLSPLKPVVGKNVFKRESGVTVAQLIKYPPAIEGYPPELLGSKREILLGKKSGRKSIQHQLDSLGIEMTLTEVDEVLMMVKKTGIKKKDVLTDGEFLDIVNKVQGNREN